MLTTAEVEVAERVDARSIATLPMESANRFNSDDVEIAYIDEGTGDPVMLIHGFACNFRMNWIETGWIDTLKAAGHRVLAYDCRGHGSSQKLYDRSDYSTRIMADDGLRLLDHLGIKRADVMGYSMGARIAAFMASDHPDRVRSVIFGGLGKNMLRRMIAMGPVARSMEVKNLNEIKNETLRSFRAFAESTGSDLDAMAVCLRATRETITPEMLGSIPAPALVVCGSKDVFSGSPKELAAMVPNGEAVEISGCTHQETVPDPMHKQAVIDFLDRRP